MKAAYPEISRVGGAEGQEMSGQDRPDLPTVTASKQPRRDTRNGQIRYTRIWISDLLAETYRLTPAAMGAYVRIYAAIVTAQAPLRDDTASLTGITGTTRRTWRTIRDELIGVGVVELVDGYLHDARAQRAIDEFRAASQRNRHNVEHRYRVVSHLEDAS